MGSTLNIYIPLILSFLDWMNIKSNLCSPEEITVTLEHVTVKGIWVKYWFFPVCQYQSLYFNLIQNTRNQEFVEMSHTKMDLFSQGCYLNLLIQWATEIIQYFKEELGCWVEIAHIYTHSDKTWRSNLLSEVSPDEHEQGGCQWVGLKPKRLDWSGSGKELI